MSELGQCIVISGIPHSWAEFLWFVSLLLNGSFFFAENIVSISSIRTKNLYRNAEYNLTSS